MFLESSLFIPASCIFFPFVVKLFVKNKSCLVFHLKEQAGKEIKLGKENL